MEKRILALCTLAGVAILTFVAIMSREAMLDDPDIWWHIATGRWIIGHAALPVADPFSHSFAGKPWIAKEWLSQLLYFWAYSLADWNGVMLLGVAALALAAALMFRALSASLSPLYALALSVLDLFLATPSLVVRPHLLTLPLLVFWTQQLFAAAWQQRVPHPALVVVLVLWANLHAAFTIGLLLAGFAFLDVLERSRFTGPELLARWAIFLALCAAAGLCTPYGWQPLLGTLTFLAPSEQSLAISEWRPFDAQGLPVMTAGLLLYLFLALVSGFRLGVARTLLLLLLLWQTLLHARFAFFLFPVMPLLLAPEIARQFPVLSRESWSRQPRDAVERWLADRYGLAAGALAGCLLLLAVLQAGVLPTAPPERIAITPAIAFARSKGLTGPVLNAYDFGGPLVFNGIPTFMDGRTDQLFREGGFSAKYAFGPVDPSALGEVLRHYGIAWTLLQPKDPRLPVLDAMSGWKRVYSDDTAVIHARQ